LRNLDIKFSNTFQPCKEVFHIDEDDVRDAIFNHDTSQEVSFEDLMLTLYSKKGADIDSYLVTSGKLESGIYDVHYAFVISSSRMGKIISTEPLALLQQLALSFGLPIKIGVQINRFIFRESIPIFSLLCNGSTVFMKWL
jgi:hypothetical protein